MTLQFGEASYEANVCAEHGTTLYTIILTGDASEDDVRAAVEGVESIDELQDGNLVATHTGFTEIQSIRATTTLGAEDKSVKAFEITFTKTPIDAQVAKNTADIDYVATMTSIEM